MNGIVQATALKIPLTNYSATLVYCDPPRNLGRNEGNSSDRLNLPDYEDFTIQWIDEAYRCLRVEGWFVICTYHKGRMLYENILKKNYPDLEYDFEIIWDYNFGLYTKQRFVPSHDNILVYRRGNPHFYWTQVAVTSQRLKIGDSRADLRGRTPSSVWPIPRVPGNSKARSFLIDTYRRTCQPIELTTRILKAFTIGGPKAHQRDLVLDLFCGTGSMALSAKTYGRDYFGLDICFHYCSEAKRRNDEDWLRIFYDEI